VPLKEIFDALQFGLGLGLLLGYPFVMGIVYSFDRKTVGRVPLLVRMLLLVKLSWVEEHQSKEGEEKGHRGIYIFLLLVELGFVFAAFGPDNTSDTPTWFSLTTLVLIAIVWSILIEITVWWLSRLSNDPHS